MDKFDDYALGLRLSHRALTRNLDVLAGDDGRARPHPFFAFAHRYADFLAVHHEAEDRDLFPMLRRHAAGRSSDAAHLTRWDGEHRAIEPLGARLRKAADGEDAATIRALAGELRALIVPHCADEEAALTAEHLREMVPAAELADAMRASARANRRHALAMASFLAHSLEPAEQKQLFGHAPWVFRRVLLGWLGERRFAPMRPYAHQKELAL